MKARTIPTKLITAVISLAALAAIWAVWPAGPVLALQNSESHSFSWGCAPGQTARLTVLNSGEERGYIINWKFLDAEGRTLARSEEPVMVLLGEMKSFDLDGDTLDTAGDRFGRIQMRGVVMTQSNPNESNLRVSVEVFNNADGKTTVFCQNNL